MTPIKLVLVAVNRKLYEAFQNAFAGLRDVDVVFAHFQQIDRWDCLVTPGNSGGHMDGGFDQLVVDHFGGEIEQLVKAAIREDAGGQLHVGDSLIVETGRAKQPYLCYAPTMVEPMTVVGTQNAYAALSGALRKIIDWNWWYGRKIQTVVCPGLCTGAGGMLSETAAKQMAAAWKMNVVHHHKKQPGPRPTARKKTHLDAHGRNGAQNLVAPTTFKKPDGTILQVTDFGINRYHRDNICECGECFACRMYEIIERRWQAFTPSRVVMNEAIKAHDPVWAEADYIHERGTWQVVWWTLIEELVSSLKELGFVRVPAAFAEEINQAAAETGAPVETFAEITNDVLREWKEGAVTVGEDHAAA